MLHIGLRVTFTLRAFGIFITNIHIYSQEWPQSEHIFCLCPMPNRKDFKFNLTVILTLHLPHVSQFHFELKVALSLVVNFASNSVAKSNAVLWIRVNILLLLLGSWKPLCVNENLQDTLDVRIVGDPAQQSPSLNWIVYPFKRFLPTAVHVNYQLYLRDFIHFPIWNDDRNKSTTFCLVFLLSLSK